MTKKLAKEGLFEAKIDESLLTISWPRPFCACAKWGISPVSILHFSRDFYLTIIYELDEGLNNSNELQRHK